MFNFLIFVSNLSLIVANSWFTLGILQIFKDVTPDNYGAKMFLLSLILTISTNGVPILSKLLNKFYRNLLPNTIHIFQFWIPFFTKYIPYLLLLSANLQIFLGTSRGDFYQKYVFDYHKDLFICREDQAAYNMIIFILFEFLLRKSFFFLYSKITENKRYPYSVEQSLMNTICTFLFVSTATFVYPFVGIITFIVFIIDYHLEYVLLTKFNSKPHFYSNDAIYELYTIICFLSNFLVLLVVNVIFQNQFAMTQNIVPEVANKIIPYSNYPPMCLHQSLDDDFQNKFRKQLDPFSLAIFESFKTFVMLPSFFGIIFVLVYSKNLVNKYTSDMKVLLTTFDDKKPKKVTENMKIITKFDNMLKNEIKLNKRRAFDDDFDNSSRNSFAENEEIEIQFKNEEFLEGKIGKHDKIQID